MNILKLLDEYLPGLIGIVFVIAGIIIVIKYFIFRWYMIEEARRLQERFENRKRIHMIKKLEFSDKEKTLFFIIFTLCYGIATIILFQVEFLRLYATDYWLLPIGIGSLSLVFFIIG